MFHSRWAYAHACGYPSHYSRRERRAERREAHREGRERTWFASWSRGPAFGVRRPLRRLAWHLDLDDGQSRSLADVLNRMKTAYRQAELDRERADADLASLFDGADWDREKMRDALARREQAIATLNGELESQTERLFEALDEDQRHEFARMLRAGEFRI